VIEISVWEAPPASLFGSAVSEARAGAATTRVTTLPEQMVNARGEVNVPFAGKIGAAGRNTAAIEADIVEKLKRKANQPQVLVRLVRNNTANVTVVGEVDKSLRMPLTDRRERLLDALAAAGGVRQPVNKMTLQLTRGEQVRSMPLDVIIRDPKQNVVLQAGDVVTSLFQSQSFTVLGATGKNEEINFEASGITLAQALGRAGGLQDQRADVRGVFLFRFESPAAVDGGGKTLRTTPEGKVPVIYRIDMADPATFFVAQSFPVQSKDILYVSNSPGADLQKFLNIGGSVVAPLVTLRAANQL
jgi:polysaccharide export outer membrane protein